MPEVPSPPGGDDGGSSRKGTGSSLAGHVCKGVGRYRCSGGRRRDPGGGNGGHRRGWHGGIEGHAGRHPREKAYRLGQQGNAGLRRGTGDGRGGPLRCGDRAGGQRAFRHLPVLTGLRRPSGDPAADPDLLRRSLPGDGPGRGGTHDQGRRPAAPQLDDGPQDHRGLLHADEQGAGGHRGHAAVPSAAGAGVRHGASAEHRSLHGGI